MCRCDISRLCCYTLVDQNAPSLSSHNISVPNWFIMHLFCSRCKNKSCVHRVELLSNLKKSYAKLCLIQGSFENNILLITLFSKLFEIKITPQFTLNTEADHMHQNHNFTTNVMLFHYSCIHSFKWLASVLNWQDDSTMQSSAFIVHPRWNILSVIAYVLIAHDVIYLCDFQQSFPELL